MEQDIVLKIFNQTKEKHKLEQVIDQNWIFNTSGIL